MDFHLLVKVNAGNVAAVMAALAPFGEPAAAAIPSQPPQPQMPPQAAYQPQVGAPPPGMVAPQGAPQMPPQMPPAAGGAPVGALQPQQVYQPMQNYAAQYRADGVGRVFARYGVPPGGGLHNCTPDQLAQIKAHFESMQPA